MLTFAAVLVVSTKRGLPKAATEKDLLNYFGCFGRVLDARVVRNREAGTILDGMSRGFGFVNYAEVDDAQKAHRHCACSPYVTMA
jgi:RNA recognition motif-containing protein